MVTYTNTYADRCEACGEDTTGTYRLDGDANAADACYECATDYAARVFCAETWPVPGDAWNADAADVLEHAQEWYDGIDGDGIAALRRDARIA